MTPCHYLWIVHVTVLLWRDTLPLFIKNACDCVAMTWHPVTTYEQYISLYCYDMRPCHYLQKVLVTLLLWQDTVPLFMDSTCDCVGYDNDTLSLLMNSTCHCVAMTWHPVTTYEQYMSLCCYDMTPCHYLWIVHVTVLVWHNALPLFMNSTCHCVAMTWCLATIYE